MKKHEHPTNRLEKMSNFFGGGNFSKLNLYDLSLGSAFSGGGFLPLSGEDGPDTVEEVCALSGNGKGWI